MRIMRSSFLFSKVGPGLTQSNSLTPYPITWRAGRQPVYSRATPQTTLASTGARHARKRIHRRTESAAARVVFLSSFGAAPACAMAPLERGCLRPGAGGEQAHPAGHWRGVVPLVPRDGSRVV